MEGGEVKSRDVEKPKDTEPAEVAADKPAEKVEEAAQDAPTSADEHAAEQFEQASRQAASEQKGGGPRLPEPSFASLVFSLASAAMMHLGEIADPDGKRAADLPMAKHTIDLLGMLSEKTKGNLDNEEAEFLSVTLRDLRLRYVQARR
ncbi:MAG: DUF1844 domain-containing protein [Deltaproteobacteria bacterium]|nr:DUF1844 domain-containing protein [Deltaproteobacteria bacterium]MCB9479050.1 DUF1844 domain-containing protein [Deltaproteobacteria bacterium]MCB9488112.1 DUF1844 domain-containing protein [Deltaproteobacteria bacterium]